MLKLKSNLYIFLELCGGKPDENHFGYLDYEKYELKEVLYFLDPGHFYEKDQVKNCYKGTYDAVRQYFLFVFFEKKSLDNCSS